MRLAHWPAPAVCPAELRHGSRVTRMVARDIAVSGTRINFIGELYFNSAQYIGVNLNEGDGRGDTLLRAFLFLCR